MSDGSSLFGDGEPINKGAQMKNRFVVRFLSIVMVMLFSAGHAWALPSLPLAQVPTDLRTGFSQGLGILMLIGFIWGVITIWGGAQKLKNGDSDGKMGIVSGIIIAGASSIMAALFGIFGMNGGALTPTF